MHSGQSLECNVYFFIGANKSHEPDEAIPIGDDSFEAEVTNFIDKVLVPQGWELIKWTRLPYLCEGDIQQAFYWLDDALFVIRPKTTDFSTESTTCPRPSTSTSFWISKDNE